MKKGISAVVFIAMLATVSITSGCVTKRNIIKTAVVGVCGLAGAFFNKVIRIDKRFRKKRRRHEDVLGIEEVVDSEDLNDNESDLSSTAMAAGKAFDNVRRNIADFIGTDREV